MKLLFLEAEEPHRDVNFPVCKAETQPLLGPLPGALPGIVKINETS